MKEGVIDCNFKIYETNKVPLNVDGLHLNLEVNIPLTNLLTEEEYNITRTFEVSKILLNDNTSYRKEILHINACVDREGDIIEEITQTPLVINNINAQVYSSTNNDSFALDTTGIKLINVCRNISICNNHIYAISGNGISLEDVNIHQLNINSNFITYCMNCLYVKPKELANLQLNGNDIEINTHSVGNENARCLNFDMSRGTASNTCYEIEITGNTIQGHSGSNNLIQFIGGVNPIENVSIVGNHISNSKGSGIILQNCKGIVVNGNTMKSIVGFIYVLNGTTSYVNIQGNTGCSNCDNIVSSPTNAILSHIKYINNLTSGNSVEMLSTQKIDVTITP